MPGRENEKVTVTYEKRTACYAAQLDTNVRGSVAASGTVRVSLPYINCLPPPTDYVASL